MKRPEDPRIPNLQGGEYVKDTTQTALPVVTESWPTTRAGEIDLKSVAIRQAIRDTIYSNIRKLRRMGIDCRSISYVVSPPNEEAGGGINVEEL